MKQLLEEINFDLLALMASKEAIIETIKNFEAERSSLTHEYQKITVPKENLNVEENEIRKSIQTNIDYFHVLIYNW